MKRMSVALGILGLVWAAASPASAQKTVKLFGTTYNVTVVGRDQTFKKADGKQVKIQLTPADTYTQKSTLFFAAGADPSKDRLLVGAHSDANDPDVLWHQLYMLTGAGDDGTFSPASATLTEFFGGAGDYLAGGRPLGVMLINDEETGVKKDRNLLLLQWTNDNGYRLYDLDSMAPPYETDELYFRPTGPVATAITEDKYMSLTGDENAPYGDEQAWAPLPVNDGHTVLGIGVSVNGGTDAGIWDTKTDKYFPVHSELSDTAAQPKPLPSDRSPHAMVHVTGNEYWILASDVVPTGLGVVVGSQQIFRVNMTLPADPSKGKAGDIKAEVVGSEELVGTALQTNDGMNYGMAIGRETPAGSGKHMLYFGTLDGKLIICTPQ